MRSLTCSAVLLSLLSPLVFAQPQSVEQIEVTGEKSAIELRAEVQQLEQNMYSLYNKLNTNDDFDVACGNVTPTGSKLPQWECSAAFMRDATSQQEINAELERRLPQTPDQTAKQNRKKTEQLNADMMAIAHQNADLAKAMIELNKKQQQLAAMEKGGKKKRSGGTRTRGN